MAKTRFEVSLAVRNEELNELFAAAWPSHTDRDFAEILRHSMALRRAIGGPAYPENEDELRAKVERQIDRRYYPQG